MRQKQKRKNIDIQGSNVRQETASFDATLSKAKFKPVLFSRGKKTDAFFTEDSKLYITPREQKMLRKGIRLDRDVKKWDALNSRVVKKFVRYQPSQSSILLEALEKRYAVINESTAEITRNFLGQFSMIRLWNASIVGSILFGMIMMTFVYRYLGQGAAAKQISQDNAVQQQVVDNKDIVTTSVDPEKDAQDFAQQVAEIQQAESQKALESEIRKMVKGYPIEKMVPYIAKQDRTVAAFIVAIAKKESSWGQHVPVLNGQDCYNYWGYRGQRKLMGTGGHTCFNSPEDAVDTIAKRLTTLVEENGKDTPAKMVLWKCGNSCAATGGQAAANKWISDVDGIFQQFKKQN